MENMAGSSSNNNNKAIINEPLFCSCITIMGKHMTFPYFTSTHLPHSRNVYKYFIVHNVGVKKPQNICFEILTFHIESISMRAIKPRCK